MTTNPIYADAMTDEDLTESISLRITKEDRELLDRLAGRMPMKALSIARIAMRLGMQEIDRDPTALFTTKENLVETRAALARGEKVPFAQSAGAAKEALKAWPKKKPSK